MEAGGGPESFAVWRAFVLLSGNQLLEQSTFKLLPTVIPAFALPSTLLFARQALMQGVS